MAEYINKIDLLADILDEECRSEKADSINALFWFARLVQRQPAADVVPRSEVVKIFSIIDDIVESWKIEEHSKETGDLIRTSYNGTMIVKCLAELKKKRIGE